MISILPQRLKTSVLLLLLLIGSFAFGQTTVTYSFSDTGAVTGLNEASPGITLDSNIGFGSFKNSSGTNPGIYSGQLRLYQNATKGGSIKIYASNGVTITKVVVYASDRTGPAGYIVDNGSTTNISISGGSYTMSDLTATSIVEFYQKDSNSGNRIYVDSFEVTYISGGNTGPVIANIAQVPDATEVTTSDDVLVSADITDDVSVASAELRWGTTSGSYTGGPIAMTLDTGGSYSTDVAIPAQAEGTTIYYIIAATDGDAEPITTTSEEQSYTVTNPAPVITNIVQVPDTGITSSTDDILVSADITDNNGIASAELRWGTASGTYTGGTIAMTLDTGDSFSTDDFLPAQPHGTTVYYVIAATDTYANPATTISEEQSYTVTDPYPAITNIVQNPISVTTIEDVLISADITTPIGTSITSTTLSWGTASGNLTNDIALLHYDGDTYISDTNIPAQVDGTLVFYVIEAVNDLNNTTTSAEQSYTVTNPAPVIANIVQVPDTDITSTTDDILVSADITDNNGIALAELRWGTASGIYTGGTITMTYDNVGDSYSTDEFLPAQVDGTTVYYVISAIDTDANPATAISAEQNYTVTDPLVFNIPYVNGFRNGTDFTEAVDFGFLFANAAMSGSYLKIDGGSMTTPAIDFSAYGEITVSFATETWGGSQGQVLSVLVSNDNGASYTTLGSYSTPSSYRTDTQVIDLSSLNGTEGRIKLEMTSGSQSIRFRDLDISGVAPIDGYVYNGTWSPSDPSGVSTAADNITIVSGTTSLTENTTANNITINTGATLNIEKVLTIAGDITINGDLVFVSTATGNGELAAVPVGSFVYGNATVQRYMSNRRSYRMVTSAVDTDTSIHANWQEGATSNTDNPAPGFGTHITGSQTDQMNGFDGTATGAASMYYLPDGTQAFAAMENTDVNTFFAGEAYLMMVRGDRAVNLTDNNAHSATTLRATGTMVTGGRRTSYTAEIGDFLMFGNPYQSAVDITSVFANSFDVNANQYYLYDPTLGTHGSYITVDLTEPSPSQYIQPGQAAQVEVIGEFAQIRFNEVDKAPGNFTATHRNTATGTDKLSVQLYTTENFNNDGPLHDSFIIRFAEGNDNAVTFSDAVKPMNFYENLGIDNNGTYLSIERREMPQPAEVYAMYSSGYQYADYTMKLSVDGLDASFLYLDDQFTGASMLLEVGDNSYGFTVDADNPLSIATDRFSIRTEARLGVEDNSLLAGIRLFPNPLKDDTFFINAPKLNGEQLNVSINDLSGRLIYEATLDCRANTVTVPMSSSLASGIYLVTLNHGGEAHTIRLIKE